MAITRGLTSTVVVVMLCMLLVPRAACGQTQAAAGQSGLCELQIEGQSIASLTLLREHDPLGPGTPGSGGQQFERPGKSVWLPAGRYYVSSVTLDGGYVSGHVFTRAREYLELSPDKPCQLAIGAPLSPQLSVSRHGKFLEMDCDLVDAGGRIYAWSGTNEPRPAPPGFTVYKNDQVIGTGTFAYG